MQTVLRFDLEDTKDWFESHHVQGGYIYQNSVGTSLIIVSVGGRIYKIDPDIESPLQNVFDITIPGDANPSNRFHAWMEQAEQYLVIQDGQSVPLIYDGATLRRSRTGPPLWEVPTGCMMAYGLGRLCVVRPTRRQYVIGDLVNSGKEVIQFTETNFLAEGGDVFIPIHGMITALRFIAVLDNSTGQGDLVIHTSEGCVSARVGELRTTWKDIQFQRVAQIKHGSLSQFSTLTVNGDQMYRATDGWRSLAFSQRNFSTRWANTPISHEAGRILDFDDLKLLGSSQAVEFDNRVLLSVSPAMIQNRIFHRGIIALDFHPLTSMLSQSPPAYDLLWTGLQPSLMLSGDFGTNQRCFVMHYDNGKNELWEVTREQGMDNDITRIACTIEGRSMHHQTPLMLKKMDSGDLFVDNIQGQVDFAVQYRPDQYPCWFDWHNWSACATVKDCTLGLDGCLRLQNEKPQYRSRMILPQPPDGCEDGDNKPRRMGYEFQPRILWTGVARIKAFREHAYDQQEPATGCVTDSECKKVECCVPDALGYVPESLPNEVLTISYDCSVIQIETDSALPDAEVGAAYSQTLEVVGGSAPYTWSVLSGALPDGFTLNTVTGEISGGMPTTEGDSFFTIGVVDSTSPFTGCQKEFSITVNEPPPVGLPTDLHVIEVTPYMVRLKWTAVAPFPTLIRQQLIGGVWTDIATNTGGNTITDQANSQIIVSLTPKTTYQFRLRVGTNFTAPVSQRTWAYRFLLQNFLDDLPFCENVAEYLEEDGYPDTLGRWDGGIQWNRAATNLLNPNGIECTWPSPSPLGSYPTTPPAGVGSWWNNMNLQIGQIWRDSSPLRWRIELFADPGTGYMTATKSRPNDLTTDPTGVYTITSSSCTLPVATLTIVEF